MHLDFFESVLKLKDIKRSGWLLCGVSEPESVASHSFNVALLCMIFAEREHLDAEHCIKLALAHDLHEAICGDLISDKVRSEGSIEDRKKRMIERKAAEELFRLFPERPKRRELLSLSREFAEGKTKEAIFVRDMDLIDMCMQAFFYLKKRRNKKSLQSFFESARREIKTETAGKILDEIESARCKRFA